MVKYITWNLDLTKEEVARVVEDYSKGLCIGATAGTERIPDYINKGMDPDIIYHYLNWEETQWVSAETRKPRSAFVRPNLVWLGIRDGGTFTIVKRIYETKHYGTKRFYLNAVGAFHDKVDFLKLIAILNTFVEEEILDGYGLNIKTPNMMSFPDAVQPLFIGNSFALIEGQCNDDTTFEEILTWSILWFKSPHTEAVVHAYTATGDQYWSDNVPSLAEQYDVVVSVFQKDKLYKVWSANE